MILPLLYKQLLLRSKEKKQLVNFVCFSLIFIWSICGAFYLVDKTGQNCFIFYYLFRLNRTFTKLSCQSLDLPLCFQYGLFGLDKIILVEMYIIMHRCIHIVIPMIMENIGAIVLKIIMLIIYYILWSMVCY